MPIQTRPFASSRRIPLPQLGDELKRHCGYAPFGGLRKLQDAAAAGRFPAMKVHNQWTVAASDLDVIAIAMGLKPVPPLAA